MVVGELKLLTWAFPKRASRWWLSSWMEEGPTFVSRPSPFSFPCPGVGSPSSHSLGARGPCWRPYPWARQAVLTVVPSSQLWPPEAATSPPWACCAHDPLHLTLELCLWSSREVRKERGGFLKQAVQGVHVFKVRVFLGCPLPPASLFYFLAAAFPSISLYRVSQGGLASSQSRTLTGSVGSSGLAPCHGDTVLLLVVAPRPSRFRLSIPVLGIHPLLPGFSCRLLPCNGSSSIYLKTQVKDQVSHCPHLLSLTHQLCLQNPPQTPLLLMSFTVI